MVVDNKNKRLFDRIGNFMLREEAFMKTRQTQSMAIQSFIFITIAKMLKYREWFEGAQHRAL